MFSKNRLPIFILMIVVFVFLNAMIIQGLVPAANDTVSRIPINEWAKDYKSAHSEKPEWFPMLFSGMPAYGSFISGYLGPISSIILSPWFNKGFRYFFFFVVGGLGVYVFLRRRNFLEISSLLGAVAFALTPYMFGLINAGHASKIIAISYIPWVVVAVDYTLNSGKWRGLLLVALASALQLWSNHPQVVYYTWLLAGFWWVWQTLSIRLVERRTVMPQVKSGGLVLLGLVLAVFMVSDPYLSVYSFQKHSNRGAASVLEKEGSSKSGTDWDYATQWSFHPKELISFVNPYFYGLQNYPTRDVKSAAYWGYMPFTQSTHYLGLVALLFAILGALLSKPDRLESFLWVSTGIILIVGFGNYFPVLFWPLFKFAPFFSKFRIPSMIYILLPFTISVLGAVGLNKTLTMFLKGEAHEINNLQKKTLYVFGGVFVFSLLMLLFGSSLLSFTRPEEAARFNSQIMTSIVDIRQSLFNKGSLLGLGVSGALLGLIWLVIKKQLSYKIFPMLVIGLAVVDFWVVDQEFLELKPERNIKSIFRKTSVDQFLMDHIGTGRILAVDESGTNRYTYFGIPSVSGYRPVKLRVYQDLMDANGLNQLPVLNMLNVKYLVSSKPLSHPRFRSVFTGSKTVYENLDVLPKAWFVQELSVVDSPRDALDTVVAPDFKPTEKAILESKGVKVNQTLGVGSVSVLNYDPEKIQIQTENSQDGFLVLSEIFYPQGWSARIDGKEVPIYKTNFVLRGIEVPSGKHTILMEYHDPYRPITGILSRVLFSLVILVLGWVVWNDRKSTHEVG